MVIRLDLSVVLADGVINCFDLHSNSGCGGQLQAFFSDQFLNYSCLVSFCLRLSLGDELI